MYHYTLEVFDPSSHRSQKVAFKTKAEGIIAFNKWATTDYEVILLQENSLGCDSFGKSHALLNNSFNMLNEIRPNGTADMMGVRDV